MQRIDSLDWQRGLLAVSIMLYHLTEWELLRLDSGSLLGRLGIYGVSMFFVLSGLSMALVYHRYIRDARTSAIFFIRRIFRIWPLLWVAVLVVILGKFLLGKDFSWGIVILNLTTLFGFVSPASYINTGAWSIGNEMVYYAMTPFVILAYNKKLVYGNAICLASVFLAGLFSFYILTAEQTLSAQWASYVHPFNNLFLYLFGIGLFYNLGENFSPGKLVSASGLLALVLVFVFFPSSGDQINIVTGIDRLVFSFASIGLVLLFYKNPFQLPSWLSGILTRMGTVTYGIYLLHPIVYQFISLLLKKLNVQNGAYATVGLTVLITVGAALLSYKFFEVPFIKLGKRMTSQRAHKDKIGALDALGR